MGKTLQEAKQALIAKGYQGEPTPAALRQEGWEPGNPLENVDLDGPAVTEAELNDNLALLLEEAKANRMPAQILQGITTVVGMAARLGV